MAPELKFCGLTRAADAAAAVGAGARYLGVIFAGGPRAVTPAAAAALLRTVPPGVDTVGVFGRLDPSRMAEQAAEAGVSTLQLHGDPTPEEVEAARAAWGGAVWAVLRCERGQLPEGAEGLFRSADAVVLDAKVPGALGGTGVPLPWQALRDDVERVRSHCRLVLAGGLRPDNVSQAVRELAPDVVDVSSGVEEAPGIKDHARFRAFAAAARSVG